MKQQIKDLIQRVDALERRMERLEKNERRGGLPYWPLLIPPGGKDAGITELDSHPAFGLPYGSSVAQSTVLPSLGTACHLGNPPKTSLRPLEEGTVQNNAAIASQGSSPLGEVRRGLLLLMECKAPDWRYDALYHGSPERFRLMRETVEWWQR